MTKWMGTDIAVPEIWVETAYLVKLKDKYGTRTVFEKNTLEEAQALATNWVNKGLALVKEEG